MAVYPYLLVFGCGLSVFGRSLSCVHGCVCIHIILSLSVFCILIHSCLYPYYSGPVGVLYPYLPVDIAVGLCLY